MNDLSGDYEKLRRYLLGRLPEEEADRLEQRLLLDDRVEEDPELSLFELAEVVEAELLDECARGELPADDCQALVDRLHASAGGRERLANADVLSRGPLPGPKAPVSKIPKPVMRTVAALAASVAVLAVGAAELFSVPPVPLPVTSITQPRAEREAKVNIPVDEQVRGSGPSKAEPELSIPPGTQRVDLSFLLGDENYALYEVAVCRMDGQEIWRSPSLLSALPGAPLVASLPAEELPDGRYELKIQGVTWEGTSESVGYPTIRVENAR
jgi:hypothetical protein